MTDNTSTLMGSLPPGTRLHEYELQRVLGHGGFGITYLARDTNLDKRVAIKEYLPNDLAARAPDQTVTVRSPDTREAFKWGLDSFIKEARVLGKFSHPSLIQVHRYFEANETAYFVMEYAEGVTLASVLKHEGTMSEERLRKIIFPILNGLEEVHRLGVLHRDIKPDNIMLREGSLPVLIDFGAARQNLSSMTRSVMSVLTAGYAPIEQYATGGNQGPWTDLYAIGAVAYRALSGKKPVDAVNRIRDDPMVSAKMLGQGRYSAHFLAAIDWALSVNPEDRPVSVADFKLALDGSLTPPDMERAPSGRRSDLTPVRPPVVVAEVEPTQLMKKRALPGASGAKPPWLRSAVLGGTALVIALAVTLFAMRSKPPVPTSAPQQPAPAVAKAPEAAPVPAPAAAETPAPATPPREQPRAAAPPAAAKPAPAKKPAQAKTPAKPALVPVAQMPPLSVFQDCANCPLMIPLAPGKYQMGATPADNANKWEGPPHVVNLTRSFAIGRHEVTVEEWQACVEAKACPAAAAGPVTGEARKAPVVNLSWNDAQAYTRWLSQKTGRRYRLPSEAEWEYAIRARTAGARYWGGDRTLQCRFGNGADQSALKKDSKLPAVECSDGFPVLAPVGAFEPNAFGLYDMAGNAWEWNEDCWRDSYGGAPADGAAVEFNGCDRRVIRGGSWRARANSLRSFGRGNSPPDTRSDDLGLRVVAE
jgi:formylglycine-generating enzyme required for sulfatase activity/serine/threonine protein kinase